MSSPNQRFIDKIVKAPTDGKSHSNIYSMTNVDAEDNAAQDLNGNQFKLWRYMAKNQNDYSFELSPSHLRDSFGLKEDAYRDAFKVLVKKRYLIPVTDNPKPKHFIFYEIPRTAEEASKITKVKYGKTIDGNSIYGKTPHETAVSKDSIQVKTIHGNSLDDKKEKNLIQENSIDDIQGKSLYVYKEKPQRNNTYNTFNNTKEKKEKVEVVKEVKQEQIKKETPILRLAFFPEEDRVSDPALIQSLIDDIRY